MASLNVKTMEAIRDDFLRTYRSELIRRGIQNPNVSFGTEIYIKATAFAQQLAIAENNTVLKGDALMPDTALDGDLQRYAGFYSLSLKPAVGSLGQIIFSTTVANNIAVLVAAGTQLQDPFGQTYQVLTTGNYKQDGYIDVGAIDTGASTNIPQGTTLRWSATIPAYAVPTASAGIPFTGGSDNETIESLRVRVLQKLSTPPGGGNWSQIAETAEATLEVQKSFVYMACNGPATCGVAIVSAPTATYKGRDFGGDLTVLNTDVIPAVLGNYPESTNFIITNCVNKPINVSIGLSLPSAKTASIPGNGSGWLDGNPSPVPVISSVAYVTGYCDVASIDPTTPSTLFTVNADVTSIPATSGSLINICWLSTRDWILRTSQATITGSASPYTITLTTGSTPFQSNDGTSIQVGDWIFPAALNTATYVAALLDEYAGFGPGQKIDPASVAGLFPRAYRRPLTQDSWSSDIGPSVSKFLENTGTEVFDVQYLYRQDVGSGPGVCPIPASVQLGPFVLIPNQLAFYPIL